VITPEVPALERFARTNDSNDFACHALQTADNILTLDAIIFATKALTLTIY